MSAHPDELLALLDELTNTIDWYQQRGLPLTAGEVVAEALDDWITDHDHGEAFRDGGDLDAVEPLTASLVRFHATIAHLVRSGARPHLTAATALTEALATWTAAAAAEHNRSQPFGPTSGRLRTR